MRRTVVVLPFEPVTSAVGTARNSRHATSPTCGKAASGKSRPATPSPSESVSSSSSHGTECAAAVCTNARRSGRASPAASCSSRDIAAGSSISAGSSLAALGPASSAAARRASRSPDQCCGSSACSALHSAHSFSSVAVNSWSNGAAIASDAPRACLRTTHAASMGQPSRARPRATRARQSSNSAGSRAIPASSSTAPGPGKNRLLPVRRRESSNGNDSWMVSLRSPARSAHRARRGPGPRG